MSKMSDNIDDLKTKGAVNTNNGPTLKGVADFTGVLSAELGKSDAKLAKMFERIEEVRGLSNVPIFARKNRCSSL